MFRTSRQVVASAVALIAVLFLSGCSTTVVGTPMSDPAPRPASGKGSDPAAWSDKVCSALLSYYTPLSKKPTYEGADPSGIRQRLSDYLGAVSSGVGQGQSQIRTVGASPVSGGDQFAAAIEDLLTRTGTTVVAARRDVDAADPANTDDLQVKLAAAQKKLATIGTAEGLDKLGATPRLDKAVAAAPKCTQLNTLTKSPN